MNNNSSTDFFDECMKEDFPYRVVYNYNYKLYANKTVYNYDIPRFDPHSIPCINSEEESYTRFDILDIPLKKIESECLTVNKIQKMFDKIKEEIDGNNIWKNPEPKNVCPSLSTDELIKFIEDDFKRKINESVAAFTLKIQINDRFEILDL